MGIYLKLTSNAPSATGVVLLNGTTDTGYVRVSGGDWGMVDSQPLISSSIDTEGGAAVGQNVPNRTISLPLCISASTAAATQALFTTLAGVVSECQRFGGKLRFRPSNASYGVTFEVEHVKVVGDHWTKTAELGAAIMVELSLTCRPYALQDPVAWIDTFSANRFGTGGQFNDGGADYTAANGSLSNIPISGGKVTASSALTTQYRVVQSGNSNSSIYSQPAMWMEFTVGSTLSGFECGMILKWVDSNNYVAVFARDTGASSVVKTEVVVGGVSSSSSYAQTRLEVNKTYYLRASLMGDGVLSFDIGTSKLTPADASTADTYTYSAAERAAVGPDVDGKVGFLFTPQATDATINELGVNLAVSYIRESGPVTCRLSETIPGDVGAPTNLGFACLTSVHKSFVMGWTPRMPAYNIVQNYGFETSVLGWTSSAVTGVHSAATSITRTTTASKVYAGTAAAEVVCPATSGSGVSYKIVGNWQLGQRWTAKFWAKSSGGSTTPLCIKLGKAGVVETSASTNLSTSWQEYSVTWIDDSDAGTEEVYVAAVITAATATTFQIDNVRVYQGSSSDEPSYIVGGAAPFGVLMCADVDNDNLGSFFTAATDASSVLGGPVLGGTGAPGANAYAEWWIHPWVLTPDDGSRRGQCLVDVYLHARLVSTQTSATVLLSALHDVDDYAAERFTLQYGSTGKALAIPSSGTCNRAYFIGTLPLMVDRDNPEAIKLRLEYTASGGASGVFKLDYLHMVPSLRSASTVTGVADTGSTRFIPSVGYEKLVRSDLSGSVRKWASLSTTPDFGLVGSSVVLPSGDVDLTFDSAQYVIDRPESDANSDTAMGVNVSAEPQPRRLMMGPS